MRPASVDQARDTGMAMVLCLLLVAYAGRPSRLLLAAILLLLLTMVRPHVFRPMAVAWFGMSRAMGSVITWLILTLVFFGLVTPVGLVRRWTGSDTLQLRRWKRDDGSTMTEREGPIRPEDLTRPY